MDVVAAAFSEPTGQGWVQITELLVAFVLSSLIGLERQLRGKSAGLRTQAIVGTASALFLLVSKYGFTDVLTSDRVVLDPSRVAAQIVSGIGFLGAGLIITRRGTARGLTTAAAVWETAAIGMAAGAGLPLLAVVVTVLHFVVVLGYTWVAGGCRRPDATASGSGSPTPTSRGCCGPCWPSAPGATGWSTTSPSTTGRTTASPTCWTATATAVGEWPSPSV